MGRAQKRYTSEWTYTIKFPKISSRGHYSKATRLSGQFLGLFMNGSK